MKKKMRRFDVGGDVRERAMRYAAMANDSGEESEGQKAMLREQAGREYGMKGEEPPKAPALKPAAPKSAASSSSPAPAPSTRVSMGSQNEARIHRAVNLPIQMQSLVRRDNQRLTTRMYVVFSGPEMKPIIASVLIAPVSVWARRTMPKISRLLVDIRGNILQNVGQLGYNALLRMLIVGV